jgi:hypothetical protein
MTYDTYLSIPAHNASFIVKIHCIIGGDIEQGLFHLHGAWGVEDRGWRVEDREKRIENNGCKRMVHGAVV